MADVDWPPGFAIRLATPDDVPELSEVLAVALFDDPPARWHIPDDERRIPVMQEFFALSLTALYLPHGLVFTTDPPVAACCWVPPGAWPPSGREAQDVEPKIRHVFRDYPLTFKVFDILDTNHPSKLHYYLPFMGVLPKWQGRGIGSALLRLGLDRCDREGIPAYLDASNEGSRALYLRHAFEVIHELLLPDGPSFWQMWREPQPTRMVLGTPRTGSNACKGRTTAEPSRMAVRCGNDIGDPGGQTAERITVSKAGDPAMAARVRHGLGGY